MDFFKIIYWGNRGVAGVGVEGVQSSHFFPKLSDESKLSFIHKKLLVKLDHFNVHLVHQSHLTMPGKNKQ